MGIDPPREPAENDAPPVQAETMLASQEAPAEVINAHVVVGGEGSPEDPFLKVRGLFLHTLRL